MLSDFGCRSQDAVYAVFRAAEPDSWGVWDRCLLGVSPNQAQQLDRIRRGLAQGGEAGPGDTGAEGSTEPGPGCATSTGGASWPMPSTGAGNTATQESPRCTLDAHCEGYPGGAHCDVELGTCHACVPGEGHCKSASRPICDEHLGERSCQSCSSDADCVALGWGAHCRKREAQGRYEPRCEACAEDQHCASVPGRPYCELPENDLPPRCVACLRDEQCGFSGQRCQNRVCMGCDALDACQGDSACWWWPGVVGACSTRVLYVDSSGSTDCLVGNGSRTRPFCRLDEALHLAQDGRLTTVRIRGDHQLHQGLVIRRGSRVQFVAETRSVVEMVEPDQSLLRIGDDAQVSLSRVELRSPHSHAIFCAGSISQIRLQDLRITGGASSAIVLEGCALEAQRVQILGFEGFGVSASAARVRMASSIVAHNGRPAHDKGGAFMVQGRTRLELEHVTLAGNDAKSQASLLRCEDSDGQIVVRDSILTRMRSAQGTNCRESGLSAHRNWTDEAVFAVHDGHLVEDAQALFLLFQSPLTHDYRLADPIPENDVSLTISSLGQWTPGDGELDVDGHRWKQGAGYVGADQSRILRGDTPRAPVPP